MKKVLTFVIGCVLMMCGINVSAAETAETPITICYNGDIYSIDFIYETSADISDVSLKIDDCMYDWNYIKSEARLYIGFASGNPIPKTDLLAVVSSDKNAELKLVSAVVNGNITDGVKTAHTVDTGDYTAPGFDTPGHMGEGKCSDCGAVLSASQEIPPTGPVVNAALSDGNTLTVSGGLSDNKTAEGVTYIAVYDKDHRLLKLYDASSLNQSDFRVEFSDCAAAAEVKIFRWQKEGLQPLYGAVQIAVVY